MEMVNKRCLNAVQGLCYVTQRCSSARTCKDVIVGEVDTIKLSWAAASNFKYAAVLNKHKWLTVQVYSPTKVLVVTRHNYVIQTVKLKTTAGHNSVRNEQHILQDLCNPITLYTY